MLKLLGKKNAFKKLLKSIKYYLYYNDDILDSFEKEKLNNLLVECNEIGESDKANDSTLLKSKIEDFNSYQKYKSTHIIREYLDILAVGIAVAFGIRALFFQPFKIPTSSMQPTLFGIHYIEKEPVGNKFIGKSLPLVDRLIFGANRTEATLVEQGSLQAYRKSGGLFSKTILRLGDYSYPLSGEPAKVFEYTNLDPNMIYPKNYKLADGFLSTGDHLFVDRISHYLTGLKRGDIVVFTTENIYSNGVALAEDSGFYYVKRLVGLPGDTIKIVDDNLYVKSKNSDKFEHITTFSDKFKKLYSGNGGYQGHSSIVGYSSGSYLRDANDTFTVPEDSYFMLGDNSKFSADSRIWGIVPRRNIIGKTVFVFWPFSRRWGVTDRAEALNIKTTPATNSTFKEMYQQ